MEITILFAVIIFLIGQVLIKTIIGPVQEAKKTIAHIARDLIYYHNVYADPGSRHSAETETEAYTCLRDLASQLIVGRYMIPLYPLVSNIFCLPSAADNDLARKELLALSNNVYSENKVRREIGTSKMENIKRLLKIDTI